MKVSTNLDKRLIKWKTSNAKVAKVASNGRIIPMGAGTCKITAYCKKYKVSCTVKIPASVLKVAAPKKISTKQDVYYDYIEKHGIQVGDCSSLKVDWSMVPNVSGYEIKLYWDSEGTIITQTVNVTKEKGEYYYSTSCNSIYSYYIYKTVKDLVTSRTCPKYFQSKKLSFCVAGGSCDGVYKVSVRSYRYVNGKKFYSKTKSKKA